MQCCVRTQKTAKEKKKLKGKNNNNPKPYGVSIDSTKTFIKTHLPKKSNSTYTLLILIIIRH